MKEYEQSATLDNVREYCSQKLGAKGGKVTAFTTQEIEDFFDKYDGPGTYQVGLANVVIQNKGAIANKIVGYEIFLHLIKPKNGWTKAQEKLLQGDLKGKDRSVMNVTLLPKEKVGCKFEDVIPELEANLKKFKDWLDNLKNL